MPHGPVGRGRFPPLERVEIEQLACCAPAGAGLEMTHWSTRSLARIAAWLGASGEGAVPSNATIGNDPHKRFRQSAPTSSDRSALPPKRLLRSAGPGSGQIRNAPPGACRGTIGAAGLSRLRFLPHLVLPSQIGFYAGRNPGASAAQARATASSQTNRRGARLSPQGQSRATAAWGLSISSNPRARNSREARRVSFNG